MEKILSTVRNCIKNLEQNQPRYAPIYYILISTFLLAINSLFGKIIKNISSSQIVFYRAFIICFINTSVTSKLELSQYGFSNQVYRKLFMRSIFGCFGTLCFFQGIKMVSISEGQVLFRTSPLWTSLMAIYYLKTEQFSKNLFINLGLCFLGIILITQPPFLLRILGYSNTETIINQQHQFIGVILMLSSAMFSSIIQVLINTLAKQINQLVILQYFSVISMFVSSLTVLLDSSQMFVMPNLHDAIILFLIGFTSYFSQLLMNRAYMTGNLTEISMLGQSQVIHGYIFDIILGSHLSILSILGTILIVASLIKVVLDKSQNIKSNSIK